MSATLSSILFKDYRRRALNLLLLHPDEQFHVREVARLTGTIAGTTGRELKKLQEAGILNQSRRGNHLLYSANRDCPIFNELAAILRKTSGLADVLADALLPIQDQIKAAFVFGSVASGKASAQSDVDLCIIGDVSFSAVVNCLYDTQDILGREINPKCFSVEEWQLQCTDPSVFMEELLHKDVINIIGDRDDLRESVRD
ncbi:nucleotidyltransferase domain-containing protein [Neptuniibacter marinus]|uniref:nucleotidyltransferase domain-containing protein n=1 Tax=Neptuniibacter marinus TaxID=1806670 RepID=UPI0008374175|nr:nucleotidyltransferase domain-containing protein [Neptuniibacter marinus]